MKDLLLLGPNDEFTFDKIEVKNDQDIIILDKTIPLWDLRTGHDIELQRSLSGVFCASPNSPSEDFINDCKSYNHWLRHVLKYTHPGACDWFHSYRTIIFQRQDVSSWYGTSMNIAVRYYLENFVLKKVKYKKIIVDWNPFCRSDRPNSYNYPLAAHASGTVFFTQPAYNAGRSLLLELENQYPDLVEYRSQVGRGQIWKLERLQMRRLDRL